MPSGFKSLKDVFDREPELKTIRNILREGEIENDFHKIFPELKKIVASVKSGKNTLIIKVDNPAWRQELKLKEENIINKINSFYNEKRIKQLRFTH
jgi:hypothetical protein